MDQHKFKYLYAKRKAGPKLTFLLQFESHNLIAHVRVSKSKCDLCSLEFYIVNKHIKSKNVGLVSPVAGSHNFQTLFKKNRMIRCRNTIYESLMSNTEGILLKYNTKCQAVVILQKLAILNNTWQYFSILEQF